MAFDFDGTLTFRDSFTAYLAWRSGAAGYFIGLLRLAPAALTYLFDQDRARLKAAAVRVFLRGVLRKDLADSCGRFADSPPGLRLIRPDAEQCWRDWRARDATLLIVTASPEEVVAPFAERLGADILIGTRLKLDGSGAVEGGFDGGNCRREIKVQRLRAMFGPDLRLAAAYGDSSGDTEMLQLADVKGYRVFRQKPS